MTGVQEWLCRILEAATDRQSDVPWYERRWEDMKLYAYMASCFALVHHINNDREVLSKVLKCFCDSEGGEVQYDLVDVCEAYCDNPYTDETFVSEVVKAAPEMLKTSPIWFGGELFQRVLNNYDTTKQAFLQTFRSLETALEKQVIVDFITYIGEDDKESQYYPILMDCLAVSGIKEGSAKYFKDYH